MGSCQRQYIVKLPFEKEVVVVEIEKGENDEWLIFKKNGNMVEVQTISRNVSYIFLNGQLIRIKERKRTLEVVSRFGKILRIYEIIGTRKINWMNFGYGKKGNISFFSSGHLRIDFNYCDNNHLKSLSANAAGHSENYEFFYDKNTLLSEVKLNGQTIKHYKWVLAEKLNCYGLSQPDYLPRVRLIHDGAYRYVSGINRKGMNLIRIDENGSEERLIYNPFTETIVSVDTNGKETLHKLSELAGELGAN
jgi:hypothetical protein